MGTAGTVVTVAPGTYSETNCFSNTAFCFNVGGTSSSARVAFVCSQNWVYGSTQGCILHMDIYTYLINYFDLGAIGAGFDLGNMPNNPAAFTVDSTNSSQGVSIHLLGNYIHDVGQNVVFGGITGCINGGLVGIIQART